MSRPQLVTLRPEESQWLGETVHRLVRRFEEISKSKGKKVFEDSVYKNAQLLQKRDLMANKEPAKIRFSRKELRFIQKLGKEFAAASSMALPALDERINQFPDKAHVYKKHRLATELLTIMVDHLMQKIEGALK